MFALASKGSRLPLIIVFASQIARRDPGTGSPIASLALILMIGMIWSRRDTRVGERMAAHAGVSNWWALDALPLLPLIPAPLSAASAFDRGF